MSRYAHVAYCDDIRPELNGKMSLMGLYSDTMLIPSLLTTLPKLGIVVTAKTSSDEPFAGFEIHVAMGDQLLAELVVSEEEYLSTVRHTVQDPANHYVQAQFLISPLRVDHPGEIAVRFKSGEWEYNCNGLKIELAPEGSLQR
ncbi:MAG TPA: hypothetical protein DEA92_04885 [Pseudomonas sp.]|nr:hypothetical protein [Pseudomonas sp.]